jgi:redox-sensitive bicupin YhaK (pirin superfamily)
VSIHEAAEPRCTEHAGAIALVVEARARELAGLPIRRTLPVAKRRHVGPFVFLDHMGPVVFAPGAGLDVPPHPHIGLATVTYLLEGELLHRDSIGSEQVIRAGDVNWMTAGSGVVHSERTPPETRRAGSRLHGLQLWVALPRASEEAPAAFEHRGAAEIPLVREGDVALRIIAGEAWGARSPVAVPSPLFLALARLPAGSALTVPPEHRERALHVVEGAVLLGGERFEAGTLLVLEEAAAACVTAARGEARLLLLGGDPLDGERHMFWNFVSSSKERIERAARDWRERRSPLVPGDETEFVPLP